MNTPYLDYLKRRLNTINSQYKQFNDMKTLLEDAGEFNPSKKKDSIYADASIEIKIRLDTCKYTQEYINNLILREEALQSQINEKDPLKKDLITKLIEGYSKENKELEVKMMGTNLFDELFYNTPQVNDGEETK